MRSGSSTTEGTSRLFPASVIPRESPISAPPARPHVRMYPRMDLTKFPLEKLFYFVAGVIPGAAALLIFELSSPGRYAWFLGQRALGYRTKLILIIIVALIIGNSMTVSLNRILGGIAGAVCGVKGVKLLKSSSSEMAAPWRDALWRDLVKKDLGDRAPEEKPFISQWLYEQRLRFVESLPSALRPQAIIELSAEKLSSDVSDSTWEQWYDYYHQVILLPDERPFEWHVQNGFNFNLQVTSLYVLISAFIIPAVRHWWCIVPACLWVLFLLAEIYSGWTRFTNRWSTLNEQIRFLSRRASRG